VRARQRFELIYVLPQLRKPLVQVVVHVFVIHESYAGIWVTTFG
jgi:hypothetical protein